MLARRCTNIQDGDASPSDPSVYCYRRLTSETLVGSNIAQGDTRTLAILGRRLEVSRRRKERSGAGGGLDDSR